MKLNDINFKIQHPFPVECNSIIQFLGNLFKFKAETIFNRRNIQYI
ncbi:MAG: hypothetical protein MI799_09475, partial [Desulfobacterales bacterium]|nr:hypothetical protein [Desulfobacterales bacterium]